MSKIPAVARGIQTLMKTATLTEPVFTSESVLAALSDSKYQHPRVVANAVLKSLGSSFAKYTQGLSSDKGFDTILAERRVVSTVENILLLLENDGRVESVRNQYKKLTTDHTTAVEAFTAFCESIGVEAHVTTKQGDVVITLATDELQKLVEKLR